MFTFPFKFSSFKTINKDFQTRNAIDYSIALVSPPAKTKYANQIFIFVETFSLTNVIK